MKCPNCGTEVIEGALYCPACGTSLADVEDTQSNLSRTEESEPLEFSPISSEESYKSDSEENPANHEEEDLHKLVPTESDEFFYGSPTEETVDLSDIIDYENGNTPKPESQETELESEQVNQTKDYGIRPGGYVETEVPRPQTIQNPSATVESPLSNKRNLLIFIALIILLGIAVVALMTYLKPGPSQPDSAVIAETESSGTGQTYNTKNSSDNYSSSESGNTAENTKSSSSTGSSKESTSTFSIDKDESEDSDGAISPGIHSYKYVVSNVPWSTAVSRAKSEGGYLAHIDSQSEFDRIVSDLGKQRSEGTHVNVYYIGGIQTGDGNYYWTDQNGNATTSPVNSSVGSGFWYPGEPSLYDTNLGISEDKLSLMYIKNEDRWYGNDVPEDVATANPKFAGKIGYIIEFE